MKMSSGSTPTCFMAAIKLTIVICVVGKVEDGLQGPVPPTLALAISISHTREHLSRWGKHATERHGRNLFRRILSSQLEPLLARSLCACTVSRNRTSETLDCRTSNAVPFTGDADPLR